MLPLLLTAEADEADFLLSFAFFGDFSLSADVPADELSLSESALLSVVAAPAAMLSSAFTPAAVSDTSELSCPFTASFTAVLSVDVSVTLSATLSVAFFSVLSVFDVFFELVQAADETAIVNASNVINNFFFIVMPPDYQNQNKVTQAPYHNTDMLH